MGKKSTYEELEQTFQLKKAEEGNKQDERSKIIGFVGVCRDIAPYKEMEKELRDNESRYRTLLENLPQKIFHKDSNSVYLSCNEAYSLDLDIKPEDIRGRTDYDFFPKEMAEKYIADDKRIMNTGKTEDIEEKYIRDGDETWVETVKTPVKDDKGNIIGLIGIFWDITHRKRIEEEREGMIKELEKMNLALKDSNQKLRETTIQLVQSEKLSALGELTAGVAHELNQPLNGIKIISQSLLRDIEKNRLEKGEVRDDLKEIVDQVNKMSEIIDHMRIYSRKSEGMSHEVLNVNALVEGPLKLLEQQLRNHDIDVVKELDADLPQVTGDPIRLEQVLMNLITNARNALDSCGKKDKRIVIRSYRDGDHSGTDRNGSVVMEVKDNGDGIPDDIKEKIFEPFFTTKEAGKGTGLGLSVSSTIIEEHGGKIEVISKVGEGTTFRVILPVAQKASA